MVDLFDRKIEREQIKNILENREISSPFFIWIEGISGAGKTQFLKFIIEKTNLFVFELSDGETLYKCDKINMRNEFSYISNIVFTILKNYPSKFQHFLQDYFDDQNRVTFLDAGCLILPQLKIFAPIKKLFETKYDVISQSQNNVTDKLINSQLIDFFSDVIIYYFEKINPEVNHFLFCIDDMQWIDNSSLKTLNSVFNKIQKKNYNFMLSVAITIRNPMSLTSEEQDIYNSIFKVVENCFNKVHTVVINNFNYQITRDLLVSKKRWFLEENIQKIYQLTNGNPMELIQTLRFSDEEIKRLLNASDNQQPFRESSYFTQEMIVSLYKENNHLMLIINILSILDCSISVNNVAKIAEIISDEVYFQKFFITDYNIALKYLLKKEIIKETIDGISISHDSMKNLVVEYLQSTGEYTRYVKIISDYLLNENTIKFSKMKSNIFFALNLLKDVDAYNAFKHFIHIIYDRTIPVTSEIYEIGAECFCMSISRFDIDIINNIVIDNILPSLLNAGKLRLAKKVSEYVFDLRNQFSKEKYIKYLYYYIKVLIEMSILISFDDRVTATVLFEEVNGINIENNDKKIQILLLGMSLYEHLLDFDTINSLYNSANLILESANDISFFTLSNYYRNKGLILSHRLLTNDYKIAYKFSRKMVSGLDRQIMNGTTLNNLGLSYFYNGCLKKAIICFSASLKILKTIGCETARILNNISICNFMLGDIKQAYLNISEALNEELEGNFISTAMQTNYALILYKLGYTEKATKILEEIIEIYYSGINKCSDEVVYSAALLNRAYIHIQEKEYFAAIEKVKESKKQIYRYEHELQQKKRDQLIKYCLSCENVIVENRIELDLSNKSKNIFDKPYSLMPFAFYVI